MKCGKKKFIQLISLSKLNFKQIYYKKKLFPSIECESTKKNKLSIIEK